MKLPAHKSKFFVLFLYLFTSGTIGCGTQMIDLRSEGKPVEGVQLGLVGDGTTPTVYLSATPSSVLYQSTRDITVSTSASDESGISRLELWIENVMIASSDGAPISDRFNINRFKKLKQFTVRAIATDNTGEQATAEKIISVYKNGSPNHKDH